LQLLEENQDMAKLLERLLPLLEMAKLLESSLQLLYMERLLGENQNTVHKKSWILQGR
jgi:hypothetical protein